METKRAEKEHAIRAVRERLTRFATAFDRRFEGFLTPKADVPEELVNAIRYAALAPGKRLRPYLVCRCCGLSGGRIDDAWPVAAAVECVHAFSLIHDDLPAMDDDELRRGQPACHKQFGEAVAILAGDALVVLAFELLACHVTDPALSAPMVLALARGVGWAGMLGGQTADVLGQDRAPERSLTEYVQDRKTAVLFSTACRLGATVGGADDKQLVALSTYGQMLGRSFQMTDDLLDVSSSTEVLGKQAGKDVGANKQTFLQCIGIAASRALAQESAQDALAALDAFGPEADDLRELADFVVARNY